jgi:hypothetical protein
MRNDNTQQEVKDARAILAELGHQLVSGDLEDLAMLAARKQSGQEITWVRSPADVLRLLAALAENAMLNPDPEELSTALSTLADHEVDELAASLIQLHEKVSREVTHRKGNQ